MGTQGKQLPEKSDVRDRIGWAPNPSEKSQSRGNPTPKLVYFHCGYCGKDGHKEEFCYTKRRDEEHAKESTNKDR
jgi:hypothetical protein